MGQFYRPNGDECTAAQWITQREGNSPTVGQNSISKGGSDLIICGQYSGLDHGGETVEPFELNINGDPEDKAHEGYHGYHKTFETEAECLTDFNRVVAAINAGDTL